MVCKGFEMGTIGEQVQFVRGVGGRVMKGYESIGVGCTGDGIVEWAVHG